MTGIQTGAEEFCVLPSGIELCYRVDGAAGEPLVLVNGLTLDLVAWPPFLVDSLVASGYQVIRFDNRDAGRSSSISAPAPSLLRLAFGRVRRAPYDLGDMAGDLIGLLDHLRIDRAHLVGMSMGGMIAQLVAARHPERVLSLTSLCSTTGHRAVGQPTLPTTLRLMHPPARTPEAAIEQTLAFARHIASPGFDVDAEEMRRLAIAVATRADGADTRARMLRQIAAIQISGDRTGELGTITAPAAVIHGDSDVLVDVSGGTATRRAITGARLHLIEGMGHDLPHAVLPQIVEIIRRTTGRSANSHESKENPV